MTKLLTTLVCVAAVYAAWPAFSQTTAQTTAALTQQAAIAAGTARGIPGSEARAAWIRAVAAHQATAYLDEVEETVALAVEIARGLRATGAWSAVDLLRQEAAQAEFAADAVLVRLAAELEADLLAEITGTAVIPASLPAKLADVPATRTPVPVVPGADALQQHAAIARYGAAWERASLYQSKVLPMRRAITEETTLRFNGMLVDVFALLTDVRENALAVLTSIEATRDFWLAENTMRYGAGDAGADNHTLPRLVPAAPAGHGGH